MIQMYSLLGLLTKKEFDQANRDLFLFVALELGALLIVVYFIRFLWKRVMRFRANQKLKEEEFMRERKELIRETERLKEIGVTYTNYLAGGGKWAPMYENSPLSKASLNEIRAGLLLDVAKTLNRSELKPKHREIVINGLRDMWGGILFFEILTKRSEKITEDTSVTLMAEAMLDRFIELCTHKGKYYGPDWHQVYQETVAPLLGGSYERL